MMALGWVTNLIQRSSASMRRINGILREVPEIRDSLTHPSRGVIRGEIGVRNLRFCYPNGGKPALHNIHLTIRAGQTVAIVGGVGSGKSTLLHTIPRMVETERGMVFIDGIPIHDIELRNLRESIGFVTQEAHIFSDTILNNIVFGRRGISQQTISKVLDVSQLIVDIPSFPGGIHSLLGEKGITLSGGQRQRLTIARALISNPPILVMDDALSQVDIGTEASVLNGVLEMRHGKTNIIVSNRISTISRADIIYVLKAGMLVEVGEHTTLLAAQGEYARLYERHQLVEQLQQR
jgi:ATP-binding cassette subfamily B multidrug efflux pump